MSTVSIEIRDARRSGAVDSVMFSDSDLISRWAFIVFESWYIFSVLIFGFVMSVLCHMRFLSVCVCVCVCVFDFVSIHGIGYL